YLKARAQKRKARKAEGLRLAAELTESSDSDTIPDSEHGTVPAQKDEPMKSLDDYVKLRAQRRKGKDQEAMDSSSVDSTDDASSGRTAERNR
nr:hypothetical protein [Tanacetum cinerariifolium]